jgi:hypothetical protein
MFGQVMSRHDGRGRSPLWLSQVRAQASGVRGDEEQASRKRLGALEEIDRRRLDALAEAARTQEGKYRRTLVYGLGFAVILGLLLIGIGLLAWLR